MRRGITGRFKGSRVRIAAWSSGKGIPAISPVISGAAVARSREGRGEKSADARGLRVSERAGALAGGPGAVGGSGRERTMCASRAGASGEASWAAAPDRASCWAEVGSGLRCAGLLAASRWATAAFWAEQGKKGKGVMGRTGLCWVFLGLGLVSSSILFFSNSNQTNTIRIQIQI